MEHTQLANESASSSARRLCRQCASEIPAEAKLCATCNSYQDWRGWLPISNTALALIAAIIAVTGAVAPNIKKAFHRPRSKAYLAMPAVDGLTFRVLAANEGDASATVVSASVESDTLAPATKLRLADARDALIRPGNQLLVFNIVPNLDEDQSYQLSMKYMGTALAKNPPPPDTHVKIVIAQSDGGALSEDYPISADDMFMLLRANSDRCSAVKEPTFENGCIGNGSSVPSRAR